MHTGQNISPRVYYIADTRFSEREAVLGFLWEETASQAAQKHSFCHSERSLRSEESLLGFRRRELLHFARNDVIPRRQPTHSGGFPSTTSRTISPDFASSSGSTNNLAREPFRSTRHRIPFSCSAAIRKSAATFSPTQTCASASSGYQSPSSPAFGGPGMFSASSGVQRRRHLPGSLGTLLAISWRLQQLYRLVLSGPEGFFHHILGFLKEGKRHANLVRGKVIQVKQMIAPKHGVVRDARLVQHLAQIRVDSGIVAFPK